MRARSGKIEMHTEGRQCARRERVGKQEKFSLRQEKVSCERWMVKKFFQGLKRFGFSSSMIKSEVKKKMVKITLSL